MTRPTHYVHFSPTTAPNEAPVWVDVSAYAQSLEVKRGRQKEFDRDEAGSASVAFKNQTRRFDPDYSAGPYYPNLKPMKRIRIGGVYPSADGYLECSPLVLPVETSSIGAYTPFSAALSIAGDLDVKAKILRPDTNIGAGDETIAAQCTAATDIPHWSFGWTGVSVTPGRLNFTIAGLSDETSDLIDWTGVKWVRVTVDVNNGSGGHDIKFYSSDDGVTWPQFGSTVTVAGTVTLPTGGGWFTVGSNSFNTAGHPFVNVFRGRVYSVEVRSGINGTIKWAPTFSDSDIWWNGDKFGVDAQGNPWTIVQAEIRGSVNYLFNGFCLDWIQTWPNKRNAVAKLTCVDGFHVLNLQKITASYTEELSSERVEAVLDAVAWSVSEREISEGASDVQALDLVETPALEHIQHVVESENGRFFVSSAGVMVFRSRHTQLIEPFTTPYATFGDAGVELRYQSIDINQSEALIYNEASIARIGGDYQTASDASSEFDYFTRTFTKSNLLITTDTECLQAANWIVFIYKDPRTRIERMRIDGQRDPTNIWAQTLVRDLGDRITVKRRPQAVGSAISQDSAIEGISHSVEPGSWITTWDLSPAVNFQPGILDDPVLGKLNQTMILVY